MKNPFYLLILPTIVVFSLNALSLTAESQTKGGINQETPQKKRVLSEASTYDAQKNPKLKKHNKQNSIHGPNVDKRKTIEIYVDNQSVFSCDSNFGSPESPLRSITAAVRKAAREVADGEVLIRIFPGTYRETILVPPYRGGGRIILQGEDAERCILSGGDLLPFWEAVRSTPSGQTIYSHKNILSEEEHTEIFFVGKTPQLKTNNTELQTGEFSFQNGKIYWLPPKELDWRYAEVVAPNRPLPLEGEISALMMIYGEDVHVKSLTLQHCARADAVVAAIGSKNVTFENLRFFSNLAPAFLIKGNRNLPQDCRASFKNIRIYGHEQPFIQVRDSQLVMQDCVLHQQEDISIPQNQKQARTVFVHALGDGRSSIKQCLFSGTQPGVWIDFCSNDFVGILENTFLQPDGTARIVLSNQKQIDLRGNVFLSPSGFTNALTMFELTTILDGFRASVERNSFQTEIVFFLKKPAQTFQQTQYPSPSQKIRWNVSENCFAPQTKPPRVYVDSALRESIWIKLQESIQNQLQNSKQCDPQQFTNVTASAKQKLLLPE